MALYKAVSTITSETLEHATSFSVLQAALVAIEKSGNSPAVKIFQFSNLWRWFQAALLVLFCGQPICQLDNSTGSFVQLAYLAGF